MVDAGLPPSSLPFAAASSTATASAAPPAQAIPTPFPVPTKTATTTIGAHETTATTLFFADKILLTVTQSSALNHWLHVPLSSPSPLENALLNPSASSVEGAPDSSLLPFSHLTATTVLGGTKEDIAMLGQTLATTAASAIVTQRPDEQRLLVVGLGLSGDTARDTFEQLVGLVLEVL